MEEEASYTWCRLTSGRVHWIAQEQRKPCIDRCLYYKLFCKIIVISYAFSFHCSSTSDSCSWYLHSTLSRIRAYPKPSGCIKRFECKFKLQVDSINQIILTRSLTGWLIETGTAFPFFPKAGIIRQQRDFLSMLIGFGYMHPRFRWLFMYTTVSSTRSLQSHINRTKLILRSKAAACVSDLAGIVSRCQVFASIPGDSRVFTRLLWMSCLREFNL